MESHESCSKKFWILVKVAGADDCWEWTGRVNKVSGFGSFCCRGINQPAHYFAYRDRLGPFFERYRVIQKCGNRLCVNPQHLFLKNRKTR